MKKIIIILFFLLLFVPKVSAQGINQAPKQEFFKAKVAEVVEQGQKEVERIKYFYQTLRIEITDGPEKGKFTIIENGKDAKINKDQLVKIDESQVTVVTMKNGKKAAKASDNG